MVGLDVIAMHVQSGFCLKIWCTINPWAFCTISMLELHVVALVLPSTCHYTAASYMAAVHSHPRPCRRSPPWLARCACRRLALSTWSTTKSNQKMTVCGEAAVGTHQGHCISQAGASLLQANKILPPNCLATRFYAIVNVVNKRENYTTSG